MTLELTAPTVLEPPAVPAPQRKRPRKWEDIRAAYVFLGPWLLGFLLLTAGPMIASLYLAFTDYNLFTAPEWVGFDNFVRLFNDPDYHQAWKVTATYVVLGTPLKLAAALGVALILNATFRATGFYRSAFYLPSLVGASVSIAVVWKALFMDDGPVDFIQQFFGFPPGGWVGDPEKTMPMLILLTMWQFGGPMVIFLAGLKQIPHELYEAASVDGAGPIRKFRAITIPMLSPVIFFNLLLETINAFQIFGSAFIISGGTGGPARSTLFYTLYLYFRGFRDFQMGYASAMAWVLTLVIAVITVIYFRSSRFWVHYTGDEGR